MQSQMQTTQQAIGHALDAIVDKGGQHLYGLYIKEKLPNHTNEQTQNLITYNFNLAYERAPGKSIISQEKKPVKAAIDINTPHKIIHSRANSQLNSYPSNKNLTGLSLNSKGNKSLVENPQNNSSLKPSICIKYACQKMTDLQKIDEGKFRRDKARSARVEQQNTIQQARVEQQRSYRRKQLENRIQELTVQGIPYGYDDSGQIFNADVAEYKAKKKQKVHKDNIFELKFRTLDVNTARFNPEESRNVTGRKRGFTSSKFYKKLRLTDEEYNNHNNRQFSTIPFVSISQGVKITEREKNIVASKNKELAVSRDQFVKQTQSRFFKSFMPDSEGITFSQSGVSERPMTTGQFNRTRQTPEQLNRTKQTAETGTGRSMRKSILWRPHTTSKTCRMNINNRELAREFVNS